MDELTKSELMDLCVCAIQWAEKAEELVGLGTEAEELWKKDAKKWRAIEAKLMGMLRQ